MQGSLVGRPLILALVVAQMIAGCISDNGQELPVKPSEGEHPASIPISFGEPVVIDRDHRGLEPALIFTSEGTIFVCAIRGAGSGSYVWRSLDGGKTFQHLGTELQNFAPIIRSGTGDLGGGDCDMATDAGGRVYLVDLWAGSSSVVSTADNGETWNGMPISQVSGGMDRPWIVGGDTGEVFVTGADLLDLDDEGREIEALPVGGIWVARSTDEGTTFPQQIIAVPTDRHAIGLNGNLAIADGKLYLVYTNKVDEGRLALKVAISTDRGLTWDHVTAVEQSFYPGQCFSPLWNFPFVAADSTGGVYLTWALINPETERLDTFFVSSPDAGEHWNEPVLLTDRPGTRVLPWITAGELGRVGIAWFESPVTKLYGWAPDLTGSLKLSCGWADGPDTEWFIHYAESQNATNPNPSFEEVLVQSSPIHKGNMTRPYAEVLQVKFDPLGRAAVVYVADDSDGVPRPTFALQEKTSS